MSQQKPFNYEAACKCIFILVWPVCLPIFFTNPAEVSPYIGIPWGLTIAILSGFFVYVAVRAAFD